MTIMGHTGSLDISDCEFKGLSNGIYMNSVETADIYNNEFNGCNVGISCDAVTDGAADAVSISNNKFVSIGLENVGAQKAAHGHIKSDVSVNYYDGGSIITPGT